MFLLTPVEDKERAPGSGWPHLSQVPWHLSRLKLLEEEKRVAGGGGKKKPPSWEKRLSLY